MRYTFILSLIAVLTFSASSSAQLVCDDLIISEYLEGTGNNKGLEFFNPTSEPIELSAYELQRWSNGEGTVTDATQLFGTHLRAHETVPDLVCRLLLEKKKYNKKISKLPTHY